MKRIVTLDIMKGLCIILVAMGHYQPADAPDWYVVFNDFLHRFRMPLFMFLSGLLYCATMRPEGYLHLVGRKTLRLMVPYLFVSTLIISLKLLTPGQDLDNPVTPASYIEMLYYPSAAYVLWFIWAIWLIFLIVPLLRTVRARTIFFVCSIVLWMLPIPWPRNVLCIGQMVEVLPYFAAGMWGWDHRDLAMPAVRAFQRLPWLPVLLLVGLYLLTGLVDSGPLRLTLDFGVAFAGITMMSVIASGVERSGHTDFLLWAGECSFIIFLFHTTFMGMAKALLHRLESYGIVIPEWAYCIEVICITAAGTIVPMLIHKYLLTRNRALAFLTSSKYRGTKPNSSTTPCSKPTE